MQGEFNAELHSSQLALEESNAQIRAEAMGVIGAADQRYRETVELAEIRHSQIVNEAAARDEETKRVMQQAFARREQALKTEIADARRAEVRVKYEMTEAEASMSGEAKDALARMSRDRDYSEREKKHLEERLDETRKR